MRIFFFKMEKNKILFCVGNEAQNNENVSRATEM